MAGLGQKGNAAFGRQQVAHPPPTTELQHHGAGAPQSPQSPHLLSQALTTERVHTGSAIPAPASDTGPGVPSVCPCTLRKKEVGPESVESAGSETLTGQTLPLE